MAPHLRDLDKYVRVDRWPATACPVCHVGYLAVKDIKTFADPMTRRQFDRSNDPMDLSGIFSGTLKCAREECQATVAVGGDFSVDIDFDDRGRDHYEDYVRLKFAYPPLPLLIPPQKTPGPVVEAMTAASSVVWIDPSSSANRLRVAVDELLTANGVRKTEVIKGKRQLMKTHARIVRFRASRPDVADILEAVKWIGNAGSHETALTSSNVLDGAEIFGMALRVLYDETDATLLREVAKINKRKGLSRKRS